MTHVIAAAIFTIGTLTPCMFSLVISGAVAKKSEEAKQTFFCWLSMVSGCLLTVVLSFLCYDKV